jgi:hypothetical protein
MMRASPYLEEARRPVATVYYFIKPCSAASVRWVTHAGGAELKNHGLCRRKQLRQSFRESRSHAERERKAYAIGATVPSQVDANGPRLAQRAKFRRTMGMHYPSPAARMIRNNPAPTATAPVARETCSPAGARRREHNGKRYGYLRLPRPSARNGSYQGVSCRPRRLSTTGEFGPK